MTLRAPIPIAVVTGFLGAGKTTLLNKLLRDPALADALVIVNEWGEIGLDHLLIERVDGDVILLASGCLCCTLRGDLVDALRDLAERRAGGLIAPFNRIVIETSGLADPAPILHAIMTGSQLAARYRFAGLVTVVDAVNGLATLRDIEEAARQAALADILAIAKSDLVDAADRPPALAALRARLHALNPGAPVLDVAAGEFSAAALIALDPSLGPSVGRATPPAEVGPSPRGRHRADVRGYSLRLASPIGDQAFALFLALLRGRLGPGLLRVKGLLAMAAHPSEPLVIHGVQHLLHPLRRLRAWPDADRQTRIVVIVDGRDRADVEELWAALAGAPRIDAPDLAALTLSPLSLPRGGLLG